MSNTHVPFPKIGQFKDVLVSAAKRGLTRLDVSLTVKVHGTNAGIRFNDDGTATAQSRNRDLTVEQDHMGFAAFVAGLPKEVLDVLECYKDPVDGVLFGEWAGRGVQGGVGTSTVDKFFYVFREGSCDGLLREDLGEYRIFFAVPLPFEPTSLDLTDGVAVAEFSNRLAALCETVETSCPVAAMLGSPGIGEGFVADCTLSNDTECKRSRFKVKGAKHSASKVTTFVPFDVEKAASVGAFLERVLTENRLNQGLEYLTEMQKPLVMASTGDFVRWVVGDVAAEEEDAIIASVFTAKEVDKAVGRAAAAWFKTKVGGV